MSAVALRFHFDVMCPWAYQTSKWAREVRDRGLIEVEWRFFSLEEVNRREGRKHPWERDWSYGWGMLRVAARLRRGVDGDPRTGNDLVDRYYATAGSWLHGHGRKPHTPDAARAVLDELDLAPSLVDEALADPTTTDDVRADHEDVLALGGFGVPTLVFPSGRALYGPVVTPAPTGDDAAALWDAVRAWERFPHLYEIKRPKSPLDLAHIAESFTPYLEGRNWESVENPAP
ncbi:MAG: DsbA family protein [Actinobacteria bacterium]|nr:DsbA family protein [Actinomycetota bacterium]